MKKRILAAALSVCLLVGLLPAAALAAETDTPPAEAGEPAGLLVVCAGEEFTVPLPGSDPADVTVSGYMDPADWYVTDGLQLMYDGIYNAGMNQTDPNAATWKELVGTAGGDLPINGQTWLENGGLTVTDMGVSAVTLAGDGIDLTDGFTWDFSFSRGDVSGWTVTNRYEHTWRLYVETLGSFGNINKTGIILFYGSDTNWYNGVGAIDTDTFTQVTMVSQKDSETAETRLMYRDGKPAGTNAITYPVSTFSAYPTYRATQISLPRYVIEADVSTSGTAHNVPHNLYGARLYDRVLTADEIARNAAVDKARYVDQTYQAPGTVKAGSGSEAALTEYDFTAKAMQTTLTNVDPSQGLTFTLNNEGEYTLTCEIGGETVTQTVTVIPEETAQEADEAKAQIEALPDAGSITADDKDAVAAAQAAFDALSDLQKTRVGGEAAEKLAACIAKLDEVMVGQGIPVTFDLNADAHSLQQPGWGEGGEPQSQTVPYKNTKAFTLPVPTRELYVFLGWWDGDTQVTDGEGASLAGLVWEKLSATELTAHWQPAAAGETCRITSAAQIYALARILSIAPKSTTHEITMTDTLKADYALFGATPDYDGYTALQTGAYELASNITLTLAGDRGEAYRGIPYFAGSFDGKGNTVTLNMDFGADGKVALRGVSRRFGGLFATVKNATVQNVKLEGSITGTVVGESNLYDMAALVGYTEGSNTIRSVESSVEMDLTFQNGSTTNGVCAYIGAMVGRANSSGDGTALVACVNRGDLTVNYQDIATNGGGRLGGLIGHAYAAVTLTECENYGDVSTAESNTRTNPGGMMGSGSGNVYTDCVQAGNVTSNGYRVYAFPSMGAASTGNKMLLTVSGQQGETVSYNGETKTIPAEGTVSFTVPVEYKNAVVENNGFSYDEHLSVGGTRLDWYDMTSTNLAVKLDTSAAAELDTPFQSWSDAIVLTKEADFVNLQKAINDGDHDAIDALYQLGGRTVTEKTEAGYTAARLLLQSAYYQLGNDVAIDSAGYTGVGSAGYPFGGRLDGQNHTITLHVTGAAAYVGLFGNINVVGGSTGLVRNLKVETTIALTELLNSNNFIGGLAGSVNSSACKFEAVSVTVKGIEIAGTAVNGTVYMGGLFGSGSVTAPGISLTISGPIKAEATVSNQWVGGAIGNGFVHAPLTITWTDGAAGVTAKNNKETGNVSVGGVVAYCDGNTIDLRGCKLVNQTGSAVTISAEGGAGAGGYAGGWVGDMNAATSANDLWLYVDKTSVMEGGFAVNATTHAGGIVGLATTSYSIFVEGYENRAPVTSGAYAGGLAGYHSGLNKTLEIKNSANSAAVTGGANYVGGLVGEVSLNGDSNAMITGSRNTGAVVNDGKASHYIGGLVGYLGVPNMSIEDCVNTGDVTGNSLPGGLVGLLPNGAAYTLTIKNSANGGALSGKSTPLYAGGLVGHPQNCTVQCENALYLKTEDIQRGFGANNSGDLDGMIALDTTKFSDINIFGEDIEILSANAPALLTVEGDAKLHGQNLQYTAVGDSVEVQFLWDDVLLYTASVQVEPKDASGAEIADLRGEYTATGSAIEPAVRVVLDGVELVKDTDYTVSYSDNTAEGTATVTLNFTGNYKGTAAANFQIVSAETGTLDVTAQDYTGVYDGAAHTVTVTAPEGAVVTYAAEKDGPYTETAPTRTNAGSTVVWYKAELDGKSATGSAVISITPKTLTITADSVRVEKGGEEPNEYTYQVDGLVEGDTLNFVKLDCSPDMDKAGEYVIMPSHAGFAAAETVDNYEVTYVNGTLTVYAPGGAVVPSYTVKVDEMTNGTVTASRQTAPEGRIITLTVTPNAGYELASIIATSATGKELTLTDKGGGKYTFVMPGSKVTISATFTSDGTGTGTEQPLPFVDVDKDAYYYEAVKWAVENGITDGTSATTFSPNGTCTRAQIVTFLWRAAGCPEPVGNAAKFTDVEPGSFYEKAVAWAIEQGITLGTSETTFSPHDTCVRAQIATFLWRYSGKPAATGDTFADVDADAYYAEAVAWAVENAITIGTSENTFSPYAPSLRAQAVTMIYRSAAE